MEFDGDLWFFCYHGSDKAAQIRSQPEVNVSFAEDKQSEWTSLSAKEPPPGCLRCSPGMVNDPL